MAENYDQIRVRAPFTTLDGTETMTLSQGSTTKGGFLSVLKAWVLNNLTIEAEQIDDATTFGKDLLVLEDAAELQGLLTLPELATTPEMEAGTEDEERAMSPELVVEAIKHHTANTPVGVTADKTLTLADISDVLVCDAVGNIEITVPVLARLTNGKIHIINLSADTVSIILDDTTLIDTTGDIVSKDIAQFAHVELIYMGDDTWYAREP